MCGRLACTLAPSDISSACCYKGTNNQWQLPEWIPSFYEYKPFYNGPPTTVVAVLALRSHFVLNDDGNEIALVPMRWGMLPPYKTQGNTFYHTHNARIETVTTSNMYKPSLKNGKRCVLVTEGYYEWQTTNGEKNKQPYYLYHEKTVDQTSDDHDLKEIWNGKNLVKLAGLFNTIKDEDQVKYTCTILTKESDKTLSWLHHRMPIILETQTEVEEWLQYKDNPYETCLEKYSKDDNVCKVNYYVVDKHVNKSTCNEPKCMERCSLKRKSTNTLDSWLKPKQQKIEGK